MRCGSLGTQPSPCYLLKNLGDRVLDLPILDSVPGKFHWRFNIMPHMLAFCWPMITLLQYRPVRRMQRSKNNFISPGYRSVLIPSLGAREKLYPMDTRDAKPAGFLNC